MAKKTPDERAAARKLKKDAAKATKSPAEKPVETPAEKPVETPAEKPVETPASEVDVDNSGKFICSKLSSDNAYTIWKKGKGPNDLPQKKRQVFVKGGAGVANKQLVTPFGVVTSVTDEEHDLLVSQCPAFNRHVEAGYLKVLDRNPSESDVKKIANDLVTDKSAPIKEGAKGKD